MVTQFSGTLGAGSSISGFNVTHQITPAAVAVPEPSSVAVAGVGVALSLAALRRRNRA